MTIIKTVNLMLQSCNNNPYTGKLNERDNILAAIELSKLMKQFADAGQKDEAMNLCSDHWKEVIGVLEMKL